MGQPRTYYDLTENLLYAHCRGVSNNVVKMKVKGYDRAIIATSIFGILVSTYALYVEMAAEARPDYKAFCDLSEHASCTRVLTSEFSKGFGLFWEDSSLEIPNCVYGIVFYCIIIFLSTFEHSVAVHLQLLLSMAAVATSFYLAYLLLFVLFDFCIVCVSTYVVNGMLLIFVNKKKVLISIKNK